ncbi:MAG: hypothetical protein PHV42_04475 [Candidatus Pacebacteria bacterium]|nr:hypothetical protein [Candidatus Paceibacterota bacterium]
MFPNAHPESFKLNVRNSGGSRVPGKPEPVDEARTEEAQGSKAVGAQYRLRRVEIAFFANHGRKLDEDNRRFVAKPILDALVNLNYDKSDENITSETTQRMDKNQINF